jgi:hypothetical protein
VSLLFYRNHTCVLGLSECWAEWLEVGNTQRTHLEMFALHAQRAVSQGNAGRKLQRVPVLLSEQTQTLNR